MSFIGRILRPLGARRKDKDAAPAGAGGSGAAAEDLAARFLQRRGLEIVQRNYRVRGGEVDLICADGGTLVFVEVRLRTTQGHGGAAASITSKKQQRVILAASHWLSERQRHDSPCRFDCILLSGLGEDQLEWIQNAFAAD